MRCIHHGRQLSEELSESTHSAMRKGYLKDTFSKVRHQFVARIGRDPRAKAKWVTNFAKSAQNTMRSSYPKDTLRKVSHPNHHARLSQVFGVVHRRLQRNDQGRPVCSGRATRIADVTSAPRARHGLGSTGAHVHHQRHQERGTDQCWCHHPRICDERVGVILGACLVMPTRV